MTPAAILSILVKTDGVGRAQAQLSTVDRTARNASRGLKTTADQSTKTGRAFAALRGPAGLLAGAAGIGGIAVAVKAMNSEYREAQKVGAQTTAVLKSTGGAARVTKGHIEDLANAISRKAGIDDEAIQSGENLLLTFTNIQNQVGKGNNIFDQSTRAIVDMSAALGQDLKSSAIQVGKALQDPTKGITALRRVGVSFTKEQTDMVKGWVEQGNTLKAQKFILRELTKEFGGSAAAQATAGDKFKVALNNLAEAGGKIFVPVMDKVLGTLTKFMEQLQSGTGFGGQVIDGFHKIADAAQVVWDKLQPLRESVQQIVDWMNQHRTVAGILAGALIGLAAAITIVNAAMAANPFGIAVVAIAALTVAIVTAYRESATFRGVLDSIAGAAKAAAGALVTAAEWVGTAFTNTVAWVKAAMTAISTEVGKWKLLATVVKVALGLMVAYLTPAFAAMRAVVSVGMAVMSASFRASWGIIRAIFSGAWTALKAIVTGGLQAIRGVIQIIGGIFKGDFGQIWDGIKNVFRGGLKAILGLLKGEIQTLAGAAKAIGNGIKDAFLGAFSAALRGIRGFVNSIIGVVNSVLGFLHLPKIPKIPAGDNKQGFARGGAFARTGGVVDQPITLMGEEAPRHPEFVIPTNPAYRKRAKGLLSQAAGAIGYAKGGTYSGRVSVFGPPTERAGTTASGLSSAAPGIALNIAPGTDAGWNNPTTDRWVKELQKFRVTIQGHSAVLPMIDKGPAGFTKRAIDVTGAGASRLGFNPMNFPTDALGTATLIGSKGGGGFVSNVLGAIGGVIKTLNPMTYINKLPSPARLPEFLRGMGESLIGKVKDWIKEKAASIVTGGTSVTPSTGPEGTAGYDGKQVAKWIIPALDYARGHGWTGHLTSGYRSHAYNVAQGRNYYSNHEGTQYPGGAVDVGGYGAKAEGAQLNAALAGYSGKPLVWGGPVIGDWGHFSATGHRKGGVYGQYIGAFKDGGPVPQTGMALLHKGEYVVPAQGLAEGGMWFQNRAHFYSKAWEAALKTTTPTDDRLVANAAITFWHNAAIGRYGSVAQKGAGAQERKWRGLLAGVGFPNGASTETGFLKIPETAPGYNLAGGTAAADAHPENAPGDTTPQVDTAKILMDIKELLIRQEQRSHALTGTVDGTLAAWVAEKIGGMIGTSAAMTGQMPSTPGQTARL